MKKQLLIAVAVFTVGFAVGYGITWLLVSGGSPNESARAEVKSGLASEGASAAAGDQPAAAVKPDPAPAARPAPAVEPEVGEPAIGSAPVNPKPAGKPAEAKADDAKPAEAKADDAKAVEAKAGESDDGEGGDGGDDGEGGETEAADAKPAEADAKPAEADAKPAEADAKPAKDAPWWDQCKGKTCAIDWGQVNGGISVRKGSLTHGSRVDWKLRFGNAPRVDTIKTTRKSLTVHGVGMGLDGLPTCAEVEYKEGGKIVRGILALKLGAKRITLKPIAP